MNPDAVLKQALFETARHLSTLEERRAYLERACADDPELRRQIETLLELEGAANEFFRDTHDIGPGNGRGNPKERPNHDAGPTEGRIGD